MSAQKINPFELHHRLEHVKPQIKEDSTLQLDSTLIDTTSTAQNRNSPIPDSAQLSIDTTTSDVVIDSSIAQKEKEVNVFPDTFEKSDEEPIELPQMLQSRRNLIFSTFIILALFLTVVISFNRSIVNKVIRSILNDNYLNLLYREQKGRWNMQFIFLYIFFIANLALFIFLLVDLWDFELINANLLYLCTIIAIIYVLRHLSLTIIGNTFPITKETGQFNFTIMLFNIFLGLVLLPVNLFIAFAPFSIANTFVYIGLGIIVLFYLLRQLRGLFIGARFIMHNKFHFLLYLCTVEIAPIAVLFKFFQPYFN